MNLKGNQLGQTLIEAVFVVSIIGLVLFGFVSASIYFNKVSRFSRDKSLAVDLAQDKIEEWRLLKNNNPESFWDEIAANCPGGTLETQTGPDSVGSNKLGEDIERLTTCSDYLDDGLSKKVKINVKVSWQDGGHEKHTETSIYFTNHRSI